MSNADFDATTTGVDFYVASDSTSAASVLVIGTLPLDAYWHRIESASPWEGVVQQLLDWEDDTAAVEDDGVIAPARETIRLAIHLARALQAAGIHRTFRVVPTVEGGIALEHRDGCRFYSIEVTTERRVELAIYQGGRLIRRAQTR
jgi:hypothetical protein